MDTDQRQLNRNRLRVGVVLGAIMVLGTQTPGVGRLLGPSHHHGDHESAGQHGPHGKIEAVDRAADRAMDQAERAIEKAERAADDAERIADLNAF